MLAWTRATITPAAMPNSSAIHTDPVTSWPIAAANAPASIIASSEMLIVPAFSATSSPDEAKSSTTAAIAALR